jgi:hypothetical protein
VILFWQLPVRVHALDYSGSTTRCFWRQGRKINPTIHSGGGFSAVGFPTTIFGVPDFPQHRRIGKITALWLGNVAASVL